MAAMSAAMLMVLAMTSSETTTSRTQRGNRRRMLAARPSPVTRPMRALTIWMPTINGKVISAVHSMFNPNCAPACE